MNKHRLFLVWLLYTTVVAFMLVIGFNLGWIQVALRSDLTYITYSIVILFVLAECYSGLRIVQINKELEKTKKKSENHYYLLKNLILQRYLTVS